MRYRVPLLVGLAALVTLAAIVARGRSAVPLGDRDDSSRDDEPRVLVTREPDELVTGTPAARAPTGGDDAGDGGIDPGYLLLVPLILAGVALLLVVLTELRRRRRPPSPVGDDRADDEDVRLGGVAAAGLLAGTRAARRELARRAGAAPADAVVAAWLRLERAAADSGTERRAHQTPTEFTAALLAEHTGLDAADSALDRLRTLYQRARFARPGAVGPADADAALAALDEVERALADAVDTADKGETVETADTAADVTEHDGPGNGAHR